MEPTTKLELQKYLLEQTDLLFAAENWETFTPILEDITTRLLTMEYKSPSLKDTIGSLVISTRDFLPTYMRFKFDNHQKLALKKLTKDVKNTFTSPIMYSTLPGEAFTYKELSDAIRIKPVEMV